MNAGSTSLRIYDALKARIVTGEFLSGERLDPVDLASELASSVTPVRDCLHRLMGERLVESWEQAGFRMPLITEADLRDLVGWSAEIMDAAARVAARAPAAGKSGISINHPPVAPVAATIFAAIATATRNEEVRATIVNLNDRLGVYRHAEASIPIDGTEIDSIAVAVNAELWTEVRVLLRAYHRKQLRMIPRLMALLRLRGSGSH